MTRLSSNSAGHTGCAAVAATPGPRSAGAIRADSSRDSYTTWPLVATPPYQPEWCRLPRYQRNSRDGSPATTSSTGSTSGTVSKNRPRPLR
jgi:hypothetical protein